MISGWVNAFREALVRLPVQGARGQEQAIEAVLDTGFNGYLTLPPELIAELGLPFRRNGRALLGDGSTVTFDIHEAVVIWDGRRCDQGVGKGEPLLQGASTSTLPGEPSASSSRLPGRSRCRF